MSIDSNMGTLSPMATLAPAGKGAARPGDTEQDAAGFASLLQNLEEQEDSPQETAPVGQSAQAVADEAQQDDDPKEVDPAATPAPQADGALLPPAWQQVNQLLQARAASPATARAGTSSQPTTQGIGKPSVSSSLLPDASLKPQAPLKPDTLLKLGAATPGMPSPGVPSPAELDTTTEQTTPAIAQTDGVVARTRPESPPLDPVVARPTDVVAQAPTRPAMHLHAALATGGVARASTSPTPQRSNPLGLVPSTDESTQTAPPPVAPSTITVSAASVANATLTAGGRERGAVSERASSANETLAALRPLLDAAAQAATPVEATPARQPRPTATAGEGTWGVQALLAERTAEATATTANTDAGGTLETASVQTLTEQIGYWVGNEIQSAHVRIDQDAQDPLQISVSLQGDEAHVRFQVESPEIRRVLETTTTDLRDLLRTQGLELAGVSIDASGTPDTSARDAGTNADAGDRRGERGASDNSSATLAPRPQATQRLPGQGSHRLDVFV